MNNIVFETDYMKWNRIIKEKFGAIQKEDGVAVRLIGGSRK